MPSSSLRWLFLTLHLLLMTPTYGLVLNTTPNVDHLVVLAHGIMGTGEDLRFLASLLETSGCTTLRSVSNEQNSLAGVKAGGEKLASEILGCIANNGQLKRISVVGNSLGGLYMRYAMKILFDDSDGTLGGLQPHRFMSIATPHLGVRDWTFAEDYGFKAPDILKFLVSKAMFSTGEDLFGFTPDKTGDETLLFQMATDESFLKPLRVFNARRLYANLQNDLVVPLGTAAFMNDQQVKKLRTEYQGYSGIVTILHTHSETKEIDLPNLLDNSDKKKNDHKTGIMIDQLDRLGWDKVIVSFSGLLPLAHNKICALNREPKWLFGGFLGFNAGQFVMKDASTWLSD